MTTGKKKTPTRKAEERYIQKGVLKRWYYLMSHQQIRPLHLQDLQGQYRFEVLVLVLVRARVIDGVGGDLKSESSTVAEAGVDASCSREAWETYTLLWMQ